MSRGERRGTLRKFDRAELGNIANVRTPYPPQVGTVAISFDAEVRMHLTVERFQLAPPRSIRVGEENSEPLFSLKSQIVQVHEVLPRSVEVEATASRTDQGQYGDIKVGSARPKLSLDALAGNLGDIAGLANT